MTGLGMAPIEALKAATSNDAELLGIAAKVGTLEKGKLAGLVGGLEDHDRETEGLGKSVGHS